MNSLEWTIGTNTLDMSRCPACGSFVDHCQGHGKIGDPYGYRILAQHDEDNHADCVKYRGQCLGE